jgi:hypothetical protein
MLMLAFLLLGQGSKMATKRYVSPDPRNRMDGYSEEERRLAEDAAATAATADLPYSAVDFQRQGRHSEDRDYHYHGHNREEQPRGPAPTRYHHEDDYYYPPSGNRGRVQEEDAWRHHQGHTSWNSYDRSFQEASRFNRANHSHHSRGSGRRPSHDYGSSPRFAGAADYYYHDHDNEVPPASYWQGEAAAAAAMRRYDDELDYRFRESSTRPSRMESLNDGASRSSSHSGHLKRSSNHSYHSRSSARRHYEYGDSPGRNNIRADHDPYYDYQGGAEYAAAAAYDRYSAPRNIDDRMYHAAAAGRYKMDQDRPSNHEYYDEDYPCKLSPSGNDDPFHGNQQYAQEHHEMARSVTPPATSLNNEADGNRNHHQQPETSSVRPLIVDNEDKPGAFFATRDQQPGRRNREDMMMMMAAAGDSGRIAAKQQQDRAPMTTAPPAAAPIIHADATVYVEISPGIRDRLRRTQETLEAVAHGFYAPVTCFACTMHLYAIANVRYLVCPVCKSISPADVGEFDETAATSQQQLDRHGVGLGFTYDTLLQTQAKLNKGRAAAAHYSSGRY